MFVFEEIFKRGFMVMDRDKNVGTFNLPDGERFRREAQRENALVCVDGRQLEGSQYRTRDTHDSGL